VVLAGASEIRARRRVVSAKQPNDEGWLVSVLLTIALVGILGLCAIFAARCFDKPNSGEPTTTGVKQ